MVTATVYFLYYSYSNFFSVFKSEPRNFHIKSEGPDPTLYYRKIFLKIKERVNFLFH